MYAVIATGGKQYKVTKGETLRVEKLDGEEGSSIKIDNVLMVADGDKISVGTPVLDKASVTATIKAQGRGKKVEIVKFRRRKNSRTHTGHRQKYTAVRVTGITVPGMEFTAPPAVEPAAEPEAPADDANAEADE